MPGISIHIVDVTRGEPARGMTVSVHALDPSGGPARRVGGGTVGETGVLDDEALVRGDGLSTASFDVVLQAGDYYRSLGLVGPAPAFQETVVYRFFMADPSEHVHLPIKLSPWGLSVWRGR
jgi:5-hydroxyisourate hydrolase